MDTDISSTANVEGHSPTSSSSLSDKENNANHTSTIDRISSQRVRSIVNEFNKIAGECDAFAKRGQSFGTRRDTNTSMTNAPMFQRQGFRNASLHVVPSTIRPPTCGSLMPKTTSANLNSLFLEQKPAKLDRLTVLQAACAQADSDGEADVGDLFAIQTQRIRLQNRLDDLTRLRNDASASTGGKRSAIIDKKARQCLGEADQKLEKLRERIKQLGTLMEQHRRFERLHEELDKWTGDLVCGIQKVDPNKDSHLTESLGMGMQNEEANFEELHSLSTQLGQEQKRQFGQVEEKWKQLEKTLASLKHKVEREQASEKLTEALDQLNEFLGNKYDLNTSAQIREQVDRINQLDALCKESPPNNNQLKAIHSKSHAFKQNSDSNNGVWHEPSSLNETKQSAIYDECTRSISTTPSSERSIPISSFTSSKAQIHGEPIELQTFLNSLQNYDLIRFAAYRTGMKMFAVQKRLCLDLVEISKLDEEFRLLPAGIAQIPWESLFNVLRRVYEKAHLKYPQSVPDVPGAIQRCTEFLRQLTPNFDTSTVMLVLIVLCKGKLDDKYHYLFMVYATGTDHTATADNLRRMFTDLAKLPALLREDRTFGASNVESTVRSCLRATASNARHYQSNNLTCIHPTAIPVLPSALSSVAAQTSIQSIKSDDFWRWIKQDPQTLVWLRVMHRLVRSEFAKHNARCASCRMQPIVGIRFRCLHCFNVDMCQNCFFTQKAVKGHKSTHDLHEYYLPTSTLDNVRDFTQIVHNKMRRAKSSNKVGYTPIDLNMTDHQQLSSEKHSNNNVLAPIEVNVDAVINRARQDGVLPPPAPPQRRLTPVSRWPHLSGQKPVALSPAASPEDLSRLIMELQRENTALWQAFERRNTQQTMADERPDANTSIEAVPPLLRRFDSSTRELAEAMNCLLALSDARPTNV